MLLLSVLMLLGGSELSRAAEPAPAKVDEAVESEINEQGRLELQKILEDSQLDAEKLEIRSGDYQRKPAVLGAATSEPSDRRELYLDYSDSISEPSVEVQR